MMDLQQAEQFLYREARLLDQREYVQWRALFGPTGVYWVPANDTEADPQLNCSIIYATGQQLDDRLTRAGSGHFWADQPPIKSVHTVSNISIEPLSASQIRLSANQVIYLFRENDQRRDAPLEILPATSTYTLSHSAGNWQIDLKKLNLLQADGYLPLLPAFI